jgi:hypothetical protein
MFKSRDTITKNFLRGNWTSGIRSTESNRWLFEDPTYTGFYFRFLNDTVYDKSNNDLDYLPQGLFLGPENAVQQINNVGGGVAPSASFHPDSAINFLQRRGEYYRANMMQEFREGMLYLSTKTPWVFEKVTGLEEIWKIDPKNNFRGKEKIITFECNESINMRMTYLIDLYRKAVWDNAYMRYMLPETQRFFSMELIVTEIRTLRDATGAQADPATFVKFTFDYCEFNFLEESLAYLENQARYASADPTKVKMGIKIGRIRESNTYGLLGALLQDTVGIATREKTAGLKNFTPNTTIQDATGENISSRASSSLQGYTNALSAFTGNLTAAASAQVMSSLENVVNSAFLGNVYNLSPAQLSNELGNILNNPISAAQGIISNFTLNQPPEQAILGRLKLSGNDVQLVTQIAQSVAEISQIVAGSNLESSSIGDIINNINASQNLVGGIGNAYLTSPDISLVGTPGIEPLQGAINASTNPGSVTFIAPSIMSTTLGQILFQSGGGSLDGGGGSVILSGPSTTLEGNPGSSAPIGVPSPLEGNPGSSSPLGATSPLEGDPGSSVPIGAPSPLDGDLGRTILNSGPLTPISTTTVDLVEPPKPTTVGGSVTLDGVAAGNPTPGKVNLISAEPNAGSQGKVELAAPPPTSLSGKPFVNLEGPPINAGEGLGEQSLVSPPIKPGSAGSVALDGAAVSNTLGNKSVTLDGAKPQGAQLTAVELESAETKPGTPGNITLDGASPDTNIDPKSANLSGAASGLDGRIIGNQKLESAPVVPGKMGEVTLDGPPAEFTDPGNTNLSGPDSNIQSNSSVLGKEIFNTGESNDKKILLGSSNLSGAETNLEKNSDDLGNQKLQEPLIIKGGNNVGNAGLEGPIINLEEPTNNIGKGNLSEPPKGNSANLGNE